MNEDDLTTNVPAHFREAGLPVDYDPTKAVKKIALADAAAKMFAKAKDAEGLHEALVQKLGEQRAFVLWWDGTKHDGVPKAGHPMSKTADITAGQFGLDRDTIHRWRKRLKDPMKFDHALEAAHARCIRIAEFAKGSTEQRGASGTGENDWHTPDEYLSAAREVLGEIDLDPASSELAQARVEATNYFTPETDGRNQEWHGRVWMNPPYAQPLIAEFVAKLVSEYSMDNVSAAIMLTHNYTDTAWFHQAANVASAICFTRGRVKFINAIGEEAAPTQGQAFFYFGDDVDRFALIFGPAGYDIGFVMRPA